MVTKKILIALIIILFLLVGCKERITPPTGGEQPAQEDIDTINKDIQDITLEIQENLSELDSLEEDLDIAI